MTPLRTPQEKILTFQLQPMPSDTATGNRISAGWLMSEMDKASGRRSHDYIYPGEPANDGRAVTVGIDGMIFKKPVFVGDLVRIYTEVARQGRSSLTIRTEAWADRRDQTTEKVTEGLFTFVAIDRAGKPVEIKTNNDAQNPILSAPGAGKAGNRIIQSAAPGGSLALHCKPTRKNANWLGDIFGGWILSRMDDACTRTAARHTGHKVASIAVEGMSFYKPVNVGDDISFFTEVVKTGTTSITVGVETWANRKKSGATEKVTEGLFTYVAVDKNFKPVAFAGP